MITHEETERFRARKLRDSDFGRKTEIGVRETEVRNKVEGIPQSNSAWQTCCTAGHSYTVRVLGKDCMETGWYCAKLSSTLSL